MPKPGDCCSWKIEEPRRIVVAALAPNAENRSIAFVMPISSRRAAQRKEFIERRWRKPVLRVMQIVAWADEHYEKTGRWPIASDGRLSGSDETWMRIDCALRAGTRGLPGGDSLARLLARHRGVRNRKALPHLTIEQILAWADAHFARHKSWPIADSGAVGQAIRETWNGIEAALRAGIRGLPGGSSLARLLREHRNVRSRCCPPALSIDEILAWADAHFARTRSWPTVTTGAIPEAPGETWVAVDIALRRGTRGLKGKSSLARLWRKYRELRKRPHGRLLSEQEILAWADAFYAHHRSWPNIRSGPIAEAPDIDWLAINTALRSAGRGLKHRSSLPQFLLKHRGVRSKGCAPPLTVAEVLSWADAHFLQHGKWPTMKSGRVEAAPAESWDAIHQALVHGHRRLPGGLTLASFLDRHRRKQREK